MKRLERKSRVVFVCALFCLSLFIPSGAYSAIIIDHNCTDLSQIPDTWIDQAKTMKLHYAHTSHGKQLTIGLNRIETDKYSVAIEECTLPTEAGALCIFDGQTYETYISPELYWDSASGRADTNSVLSNNPTIILIITTITSTLPLVSVATNIYKKLLGVVSPPHTLKSFECVRKLYTGIL